MEDDWLRPDADQARPHLSSAGTRYQIRPIRPDDAQREREFIARLSPQSRYQRFMHSMGEPGPELIDRLVHVDHDRTMALVAVVMEEGVERIIGVARYAADDAEQCEFAVAVADDWQCRGVATTLVPLLFEHAARRGFRTIYGSVLADNQRMIQFAQWLGLTVDAPRAGESVVRAWRRLEPPGPDAKRSGR
jgi:acetyltransferase